MTRRIKRHRDFRLELDVTSETFIRPPRDAQRNWLLNQALGELAENLEALDRHAAGFAHGSELMSLEDRTQATLADEQIMEDWQVPLMRAMAGLVTGSHGSVLEIGFGRGVASTLIQDGGVARHTIIECNDDIVGRFERWREAYPDRDIRLVHGKWQDTLPGEGAFDAIFFHTYPLDENEFIEQIAQSTTFAAHFFEHAARHLVAGGVFTYLSNEIDSLSRGHQRELFRHFSEIGIRIVRDLPVPDDVRDAWWADSMAIVRAVR